MYNKLETMIYDDAKRLVNFTASMNNTLPDATDRSASFILI